MLDSPNIARITAALTILVLVFGPAKAQISNKGFTNKWLPESESIGIKPDPTMAAVNAFLENLHGSFRPMVCWYDGSKLIDSESFKAGSADGNHARKPLGYTAFMNWPKVSVKSGGS